MIFHHHKTIYYHIGKTAGSSMEYWLWPGMPTSHEPRRSLMWGKDTEKGMWLQHATPNETAAIAGEKYVDEYFNFTIVRNPFTRLISVYHYQKDTHDQKFGGFIGFIDELYNLHKSENLLMHPHYMPQVNYVYRNGKPTCDYIGYFEKLPRSTTYLSRKLGIKHKFPRLNTSRFTPEQSVYSAIRENSILEKIVEIYNDDFEVFGYSRSPDDVRVKKAKLPLRRPNRMSILYKIFG